MITKIALLGSSRIHLGAVALVTVALNVRRKALAARGRVLAAESERLRGELDDANSQYLAGTYCAREVRDAALVVAARDAEAGKKAANAEYERAIKAAGEAHKATYQKAADTYEQRCADAIQDHSYAVEQYERNFRERGDELTSKLEKNSKGLQEVLDIAGQIGVPVQ